MKQSWLSFATLGCVSMLAGACGNDQGSDQNLTETPASATDRIVGGEDFSELPAVGALMYNGEQHCTGTLIGPRTVLTAAHCVVNVSASKMRFAIGPKAYSPQYSLRVASVKAHSKYDSYAITNDIGIVTLSADAPVDPMPVLLNMDNSYVGKSLFFVGYGVNNGMTQSGAGKKRAVWMKVSRVDSTTFRYDDAARNTCNGDSGGPAFVRDQAGAYFVAGVTSYGDYYCTQYGVDTRVDAYLSFLGVNGSEPSGDSSSNQDAGNTPAAESCNGETFVGRCSAEAVVKGSAAQNFVVWCENGRIYNMDCAEKGQTCLYDEVNQYYGCGDASKTTSDAKSCKGESFVGRCDGNNLVWCENGEVFSVSCADSGASCHWDGANGYHNCHK